MKVTGIEDGATAYQSKLAPRRRERERRVGVLAGVCPQHCTGVHWIVHMSAEGHSDEGLPADSHGVRKNLERLHGNP